MKKFPITQKPYKQKDKQKGAILIISMIMLFLLSIVAVNTSKNTTVREKVSSTNQKKMQDFQASQSAIDVTLKAIAGGDNSLLKEASQLATNATPFRNVDIGSTTFTSEVSVVYLSEVKLPTGQTVDADQGNNIHTTPLRYKIVANGYNDPSNKTRIEQGLEIQ